VLSGTGARATKDGCEGMAWAFNASNIPVEVQEARHPIVVERFQLIRDSGGAGKFRGGCGIRRDLKFLADDGKLTNLTDRQRVPSWGLFGGSPGVLGRTVLNPGPAESPVHGKESRDFAYGDVVSFQQSGAGGYGHPFERDPARVLEDVLDDYVSLESARADYGVVITGTGMDLQVDDTATQRLRAELRARSHAAPEAKSRDQSHAAPEAKPGDQSHAAPEAKSRDQSHAAPEAKSGERSHAAPRAGHPRSKPASPHSLQ
jgi:N-methylhydantoinase B